MNKDNFIKHVEDNFSGNSRDIVLRQIDIFYKALENYKMPKHNYEVGDDVFLSKGTLLHGTYKNFDGLKEIIDNGLISSIFISGRTSKYPGAVGVWNLKDDYLLKDYINFYSGGTIMFCRLVDNGRSMNKDETKVISYDEMKDIIDITKAVDCHMWVMEQTKEARFLPSLVQNGVQIGIIFNGNNIYVDELLKGDILNLNNNISDEDLRSFVNKNYYDKFIKDRENKNDFFTDRESAIVFGIPSNLIEGILVGRDYEKDSDMLDSIKSICPECYICNLDGKVIRK